MSGHPTYDVLRTPGEAAMAERPVCDFCHEPEPSWRVPSHPFDILGTRSLGEWLACDDCAPYIVRGDWDGLIARVTTVWVATHDHPMTVPMVVVLRLTYEKLAVNMTGPPQRL